MCILIPPLASYCIIPKVSVHVSIVYRMHTLFLLRNITLYDSYIFLFLPIISESECLYYPLALTAQSGNPLWHMILLAMVPYLYTAVLLKWMICLFKIPTVQLRISKNFQWEYKEIGAFFTSRHSQGPPQKRVLV